VLVLFVRGAGGLGVFEGGVALDLCGGCGDGGGDGRDAQDRDCGHFAHGVTSGSWTITRSLARSCRLWSISYLILSSLVLRCANTSVQDHVVLSGGTVQIRRISGVFLTAVLAVFLVGGMDTPKKPDSSTATKGKTDTKGGTAGKTDAKGDSKAPATKTSAKTPAKTN
jgi:hypothetical protein